MTKLNDKQLLFAKEYVKDFNGTQAYMRAYKNCTEETARRNASKLLTNTDIQSAIKDYSAKQMEKIDVSVEDILRELKAIAFADRTKIAKIEKRTMTLDSGNEIDYEDVIFTITDELDEEMKKTISGYKKGKYGISVESYDKLKALELLGKHLNMFSETVKLEDNTKSTSLLESINKQLSDK